MTRHALAPLAVLIAGSLSMADTKPAGKNDAVEKAVAASLDAARKLDWAAYARTIHPDSLKSFKDDLTPVLKAAAKKGGEHAANMLSLFDGASDLNTVLGWTPAEFFVRFMKGTVSKSPLKDVHAGRTVRIVGTVPEGGDAHVVVRACQKVGKTEVTRMEVVTVKRDGGAWKVVLPAELRVLAETIKLSQPDAVNRVERKDEVLPDRKR